MSNNFHKKSRFWKIDELETFGTRKTILRKKKKNRSDEALPESVQSCFDISIHLSVFFPANYF